VYRCPPEFPPEESKEQNKVTEAKSVEASVDKKAKGKKSKVVSKTGTGVVRTVRSGE
jgi:hypothetical protein